MTLQEPPSDNEKKVMPKTSSEQESFAKESEAPVADFNYMEELNSLIGITSVKKNVSALVDFVNMQRRREQANMKALPISQCH